MIVNESGDLFEYMQQPTVAKGEVTGKRNKSGTPKVQRLRVPATCTLEFTLRVWCGSKNTILTFQYMLMVAVYISYQRK
jgi:hypothetical protein